jgi:hypothetical protein
MARGGGASRAAPPGGRGRGSGGEAKRRAAAGADGAAAGSKAKRARHAAAAAPPPVDEAAQAAELAAVWRQLGEDLGLPDSAPDGARQRALLRFVGCDWAPGGALTSRPPGLRPSPLALDALPANASALVLALLSPNERYACAHVSHGWRMLVHSPAAWPLVAPERVYEDGYADCMIMSLARLAHFLYADQRAVLPGVRVLDARERQNDVPSDWKGFLVKCPNLEELRCGLPPLGQHPLDPEWPQADEMLGCERGPSVGMLLELARAYPALRCPGAHVVLRPMRDMCGLEEDPIADFAALLALHPRIEVTSFTLSLELSDFHEAAQADALAAALAQPGGAALLAVDLASCVPGDTEAGIIATALRDHCPRLRFLRLSGWTWPEEIEPEPGGGDIEALRAIEPGFAALLSLHLLPPTPLRPHGLALSVDAEEEEVQQFEDAYDSDEEHEDDDGLFADGAGDYEDEEFEEDDEEGDVFGDEDDEEDAWG